MNKAIDIEEKRKKEKMTMKTMVEIYCRGNHHTKRGLLCKECEDLLAYANMRTDKCPFMETKTFCSACKVHCYSKAMQARVKAVMRYAGPRMLFAHPVLAIRHVKTTLENRRKNNVQ